MLLCGSYPKLPDMNITFEDALKSINENIKGFHYPKAPAGLYRPIHYMLSLKGKKIRPALTLLAYSLYKDEVSLAIYTALAWEIFHNFTLMHDDVMDNAIIRRGQPTVHKVWNENTAILSGDSMLIIAYQTMMKSPSKYVNSLLSLFSTTAIEVCEGQQYDMEFENRTDVTEEEYLEMIRLKTAVLLGACLKSGGIIGDADAKDAQSLYDFGVNLGLAFQIKDDLLDIYGDPQVFGKATGGDILCNKKTYFLINALRLSSEEDRIILLKWLNQTEYDPNEKIRAITGIYDKYALKKNAEKIMDKFYQQAMHALKAVCVPEEKKAVLYSFSEHLMKRDA